MNSCISLIVLIMLLCACPVWANDAIEQTGDIVQLILPFAALGHSIDLHDREGSLQFLKSAALANGITHILKPVLNRQRPNGKGHSFPSGHTTAAFLGAGFFQRRYGWTAGLPAYAMAAFVGYSRIESNNHHLSDVLAGAVIGIGSTYLFTTPQNPFQISPFFSAGQTGVAIRIRW